MGPALIQNVAGSQPSSFNWPRVSAGRSAAVPRSTGDIAGFPRPQAEAPVGPGAGGIALLDVGAEEQHPVPVLQSLEQVSRPGAVPQDDGGALPVDHDVGAVPRLEIPAQHHAPARSLKNAQRGHPQTGQRQQ